MNPEECKDFVTDSAQDAVAKNEALLNQITTAWITEDIARIKEF